MGICVEQPYVADSRSGGRCGTVGNVERGIACGRGGQHLLASGKDVAPRKASLGEFVRCGSCDLCVQIRNQRRLHAHRPPGLTSDRTAQIA